MTSEAEVDKIREALEVVKEDSECIERQRAVLAKVRVAARSILDAVGSGVDDYDCGGCCDGTCGGIEAVVKGGFVPKSITRDLTASRSGVFIPVEEASLIRSLLMRYANLLVKTESTDPRFASDTSEIKALVDGIGLAVDKIKKYD